MNYDARAVCAWLPRSVLHVLRLTGRAEYRGDRITWKGRKSFTVTTAAGSTIHLWDCFPFYESSLDAAAEKYLHERKAGIPRAWYPKMAWALQHHAGRVVRYCRRDAALTQRLWEGLEKQCNTLGVSAFRAASPASVARRAYAPTFKRLEAAAESNRDFERSYFGGRTEVLRRGHLQRVHAYDIHSAYPGVAAGLLDPTGCRLVRWDGTGALASADVAYGTYHVVLHVPCDDHIPPVPYRAPGRLIYPAGVFETNVDAGMFRFLRREGYRMRVLHATEYRIETARPLFPDISAWYLARQTNPAVKLAAKKVLNSLYGKCAERIRMRGTTRSRYIGPGFEYCAGKWYRDIDVPSRHTAFCVAGAIAGGTRLTVLNAMRQCPQAIVAVHTDGILSTEKLDVTLGEDMGTWGYEGCWSDAWIIGTGMGIFQRDGETYVKCRGVHADKITDITRVLKSRDSICRVGTRHAVTLHECSRDGYYGLNEMLEIPRALDANMDEKRVWPRPWISFREMACASQRSAAIVVVEKRALGIFERREGRLI